MKTVEPRVNGFGKIFGSSRFLWGPLTDGLGMPHGSEKAAVQAILFMAEMT